MIRSRSLMLALSLAAPVVLGLAAPASAHADYRGSNPADGASVSSAPSQVTAEFTEPPASGSTLRIFDPCGQQVDSGNYSYQGFPLNQMSVSMSSDRAGEFTAEWTVISEADGHTTRGYFSFTASQGSGCPSAGGGSGDDDGSDGDGNGGSSAPARSGTSGSAGTSGDGATSDDVGQDAKTKKKTKGSKKRANEGADDPTAAVTLVQDQTPLPEEGTTDEDEIPVDWLIVGLSIAALIGAVGGRIYAGIVSPRR